MNLPFISKNYKVAVRHCWTCRILQSEADRLRIPAVKLVELRERWKGRIGYAALACLFFGFFGALAMGGTMLAMGMDVNRVADVTMGMFICGWFGSVLIVSGAFAWMVSSEVKQIRIDHWAELEKPSEKN